ncbi:hypothetical protein N39L_13880 [Limnospira platensis NIES-39]|jgi:hypothetical protein|uniref:Transposase n=1 Tax=Limnospira platensis NIES-46 TaxID=1236695 RepID=A0A5M3TE92_LIMPL|nr:hypothetical protein NIES39_C04140 [Arthrospira platensis NIES-39]BDT11665.1 hypothetical protein N39L_13880 [Arthrospira platensis NIES-39]GCE95869.1 hypothetical protein NIES46_39350 [Arthrospira platensis NIES-46]
MVQALQLFKLTRFETLQVSVYGFDWISFLLANFSLRYNKKMSFENRYGVAQNSRR